MNGQGASRTAGQQLGTFCCVLLVWLLAAFEAIPTSADPPEQWVLERTWGEYGRGPGQFDGTTDVLVVNDRVYVCDVGNDRIQVFNTGGEYLFSWGETGSGNGEFHGPFGIAVDETAVIHVTDKVNCRVQMFSLDGQFVGAWPSRCGYGPGELSLAELLKVRSGYVYVVAHSCLERFRVDGSHVWEVPPGPGYYHGIVLGSDGSLWTSMDSPALVRQFTPNGELLREWPAVPPGSQSPWPLGLDIDPEGNIYVANSVEDRIDKYSPDGEYLESIAAPVPRALDIVDDREMYVVTLYGHSVYKFVKVPVAVEDATWGRVKSLFR